MKKNKVRQEPDTASASLYKGFAKYTKKLLFHFLKKRMKRILLRILLKKRNVFSYLRSSKADAGLARGALASDTRPQARARKQV
jgi:hypothetical protein